MNKIKCGKRYKSVYAMHWDISDASIYKKIKFIIKLWVTCTIRRLFNDK